MSPNRAIPQHLDNILYDFMGLSRPLFLILILLSVFLQPVLAIDEVLDNYENETNILIKYNIIRNESFNAMELKWELIIKKKKTELFYYESGYFYTINMLYGLNQSTIAILLNTTIPKKCSITVEFSQDNLTWVNDKNMVGSYEIRSGFQTIDLRDLSFNIIYFRFNLTNGGKTDYTPRLYQLRLIYDDHVESGGTIPSESMSKYYALAIILLILGILLGLGMRKR